MACNTHTNEAQVHNLVGTCRIGSCLGSIDLLAVSNLLPNALFEKQKFAAITIRLGEPTCTVLLFTSGKMVLTGCKSLLDCILASKIVANLWRSGFPGTVFTLDVIKIQNIVGNAHVPMQANEVLDLQRFYKEFNIFCTYQPNLFPGLIYRPAFCRAIAGTTSCTSGHARATPGGWHFVSGSHFTFYRDWVLIFVHLAFVPMLILSFELVGPAAAHAPCVGSQKLPLIHMYCRNVLSSCQQQEAQFGAVRGGAKQSDDKT